MLKLGLTGGIACGKSMLADMLAAKGALIIDADRLAREAVEEGQPAWREIRDWLGDGYFLEDGNLDRRKVGDLVFASTAARQRLDSIVHPRVIELFQRRSKELEQQAGGNPGVLVWDVPLLLESKMEGYVDLVLVVAARQVIQVERLKQRDGLNAEQALQRIRSQMPVADKIRAADYVIYNNGTREELRSQVDRFWNYLQTWINQLESWKVESWKGKD